MKILIETQIIEPHKPDFSATSSKMSVKVRVKIKGTAAKRVEKEGVAFVFLFAIRLLLFT